VLLGCQFCQANSEDASSFAAAAAAAACFAVASLVSWAGPPQFGAVPTAALASHVCLPPATHIAMNWNKRISFLRF